MEATPSRLVARQSRYDHSLRVPHYPEDPKTQPTFDVHGLNPDLARRFHNVRSSSNVVDFSTNSNVQLVHEEEEAVELMNSNHHHQQDYYYFDHFRRYNINPQQYCTTNWPSDDQLSNIDHYSYATSSRNAHQEGLSLSLSSNPYSNNNYIVKADTRQQQQHYNLGFLKYSYIHNVVVGGGGKEYGGNALQADVTTTLGGPQWRSSEPLGPFTGYATILKSSKFLKPAQDLLDELCDFPGHHHEPVETMQIMLQRIAEESSIMSTGDIGGWSSSSSNNSSFAVEHQQKKTALFYMSDEVCRRYKNYYQQMQMVVISFEAVAAFSASTPYISLALKAVARNFRCLKNAISEQLRNVKNSLMMMEDTNCSIKVNIPRSCFQRRSRTSLLGSNTTAFFNAQSQYGWRPQRGLPERSVAILRAWLFEHFLHPYPTDTDKHMLANQTGLSRNQVSNWFINARVRLWRPMVEEIHELETKAEGQGHDSNPNKQHHVVHDSISIQRDDRNANPPPPTESAADEPITDSPALAARQGILETTKTDIIM